MIDYSQNNIFVFDKLHFIQSKEKPQLDNYDHILVQNKDDKIIESFLRREVINLNMDSKDVNVFYKSVLSVCKKFKTTKIPEINNYMDSADLPNISVCMPTYNRRKFMKLVEMNYNNTTYPKDKIEFIVVDDGTDQIEDALPKGKKY